ncbi:Crp/Fnr family transcriptional regulator [Chitinophaga nivalis]|uniref:Crp/Fnr family transcriptional regulator n=1 Tax=Chitinophaga nivalis TaxID=2991709 RepID=A0ABT3IR53_9BACT|nr:Crp/Fnr family transcriptional regulator [Chitinophaga nivalis]MCW3463848.1 Crp/Fnr family transcriptional regulator [Chitinophaga nivalis]MCW3486462.1 Crp/Fnr family transcriptional regulator [Chitinophaga nivalis]
MADLQTLQQQLAAFLPAADNNWETFERILRPVNFKAGDYLASSGKVADAIYYITEGIVRVFTRHQETEISMDFAFPGMFTTSYASLITQTPAVVNLQAVTAVSGYAFYYPDLQQLYQVSHAAERTGRIIAEQQYLRKYRRELSFLQHSAQERYMQLLEEYPAVVQHIPIKQIASYLGIKPESLSRIRKNLRNAD